MLCEERGLGLTILKGVIEVHNDKIWARFVVEVIVLTALSYSSLFIFKC